MSRVGVIGAGGAGLCAAKHLLAAGLQPQVWEATSGLGGTWRHSTRTGTDLYGLPIFSSMYNNLRTNLPKEVMAFPDFPFPSEDDTSFVHHTTVSNYLNRYATHFNLLPHIKTEHHVQKVAPLPNNSGSGNTAAGLLPRWAITVRDLKQQITTTDVYDAVVVCNGHYSKPSIPSLPGVEEYQGRQIHSHDYREPKPFTGQTVLVLGAGASGIDIAIELCSTAKQVYLSHNQKNNIASDLPKNLHQVKGASEATRDGFILTDATRVQADVIIYCTGYEYTFSFLCESCGVGVSRGQVTPLYRHIHNVLLPSMAFIGIPVQICPFPFFDTQVRYVTKVLTGKVSLPSPKDMEAITQQEFLQHMKEGHAPEDFHLMSSSQWEYMRELTDAAGEEPLPSVIKTLFTDVRKVRNNNLLTYKQNKYRFTGPETYEVVQ
ncbi:hypothetical protein Pmani_018989 [Petrolisthes manimaculis]|uniref:Flavin-containing monooxygenase n=1 Tax=Petrolisthes manimaculis TaxID=1843537 RepID=A0AAE1PLL5_9EUCA|nr:hypothetical protein Pmani_018989 [Petrolisthes manimaculis]